MNSNDLFKNMRALADTDNCEMSLDAMLSCLLLVSEKLKNEIRFAIEKDLTRKEEQWELNVCKNYGESHKKILGEKTELEELLESLDLHKRQKQNLIIKKAILLKLEEVLFGNNDLTMSLDLRKMRKEENDGKLDEILGCRNLVRFIPQSIAEDGASAMIAEKTILRDSISTAKSPPDILKSFRPKTPKKIAVNLIKQQYNIRWNTESGEPKPFDFFLLPKQFVKGNVRKIHIQTELYEHKADIINLQRNINSTGHVIPEDFCPKSIFATKNPYCQKGENGSPIPSRARDDPKFSWQKWSIQTANCVELGFEFPMELKWIDPKVKTLIKKLSHPMPEDFNPESTENVMYLLVINESSPTLLLEGGNCSQVYIGAADEGLKHRFLDHEEGHCASLKQAYDEFTSMESFAPKSTALLVELRVLLALARREQFAVFALRAFDDPRTLGRELHDLIIQALYLANNEIWGPAVNMKFGLNVKEELKKRRKYLPDHFPGSRRGEII